MEPSRDFEVTVLPNGDLRPSGRSYRARQGEVLTVRELTASEIRTARQLRYWFGAVVKAIRSVWAHPPTPLNPEGRGIDYGKDGTHYGLLKAFADEIETPFGSAHPFSRSMTKAQFSRLVDAVRLYADEDCKIHVPTPEEWNGEDAS